MRILKRALLGTRFVLILLEIFDTARHFKIGSDTGEEGHLKYDPRVLASNMQVLVSVVP